MFYVVPYRVLFHDTMAYGTQHFLTNFKFQCEARELLLFQQILDRCDAQERRTFDDVAFLTQDAFSRNLNGVPPGERVAILLSLEEPGPSSARFCFRVVGQRGQPVACGFQTVATVSIKTRQLVAAPAPLRRYGHVLREQLSTPSFERRVIAGDTASIFSTDVLQTATRALQSQQSNAFGLVSSAKWQFNETSAHCNRLEGKLFLFPGTGSLAWEPLVRIVGDSGSREILARVDALVRPNFGYGIQPIARVTSEAGFKQILAASPGIDQIANYVVSVLCARLLESRGEVPAATMGHSVGELSALAVAGAYSFEQGLEIICKRISALASYRGTGGMLVLSADSRRVESLIGSLGDSRAQISVVNHGEQVVVSGTAEDLARLRSFAGHMRIGHFLLPSEYPFHSRLLEGAVARFSSALGASALQMPDIPVYSPLEHDFYGAGLLANIVPLHLIRPLDYRDAITRMYELGVRTFVDCSTGTTLKGIVNRVLASQRDVVVEAVFGEHMSGARRPARQVFPASSIAIPSPRAVSAHARGDGPLPIAVVGLGCVLPGADNADALWENVKNGVTSIVDLADIAPLEAADFLSRGKIVPDKTYSLLSGLVDGASYGSIQPAPDGCSLAERILTSAVTQAVSTARNRARVQLIMGSTADGYFELDEALLAANIHAYFADATPSGGDALLADALQRVFLRTPQSALANNPGATLNRVARKIFGSDIHAIAIDAACASSLYAIHRGMELLRENKIDLAVCGGVFAPGPANGCLFSQFGGLSATGSRPFDASADGVVFCPGAAALALKRLPDALRDGDHIEAVIRDCGTSSDGKGASVIEPKKQGQVLAMQRAYAAAQVDLGTVQYVEAHATATRVGDAVEFSALREVFKDQHGPVALGSIKSIIGHTGWAAGAASVIKVCCALKHKTIPLQPNFSAPSPDIELTGTPFSIPLKCVPWLRQDAPRRAGVNGFGFGGTNSHLIVEEFDADYHAAWNDAEQPRAAADRDDIVVVGVGVLRPEGGAVRFDDSSLKLPQRRRLLPEVMDTMDRSQILAIIAADHALSGLGDRWPEWCDEIGIVLGLEGKTVKSMQATERIYLDRIARLLSASVSELGKSDAEQRQAVQQLLAPLRVGARASGPYTLPGLMPNLTCGRVANLFDLRGPNFVIDAAGASLLEAFRFACSKLQHGESKIMLTGGVAANVSSSAPLMTSEYWHRGRPLGEAAIVLALTRADFARQAGLESLAQLSIDERAEVQDTLNVGSAGNYLMGAEGAYEIEVALSQVRDGRTPAAVRWPMPTGRFAGLSFAPTRPSAELASRQAVLCDMPQIDYCAVRLKQAPATYAAQRTDLRDAKIIVLCDQPQALDLANSPHWIWLCPSAANVAGARRVDLSSEAGLTKILSAAELNEAEAILCVKDLRALSADAGVAGDTHAHTSLDLLVALARLMYPQIQQGRTQLLTLCCSAWDEEALHPWTGLFGGTVKSLARELPDAKCMAIHSDESVGKIALDQLHDEATRSPLNAPHEVFYRRGVRHEAKLVRVVASRTHGFPLERNSLLLATGGGRGVTAKLIEAVLERRPCDVVIFGRVDPNDLPLDLRHADEKALQAYERRFYQNGLQERPQGGIRALKQRFEYLRACWEVQGNLAHLRTFGSRVEYMQADITDATAVDRAIAALKQNFGRLDFVIHGAGIQHSRTLDKKTLAEYRAVVRTKIDGLVNLQRACARHFPASRVCYHLVTSTFSVLGNDGQADYGAANEMLNRLAQWHRAKSEPWSALAWLGWANVGMTRGPEYKQLAERRGLRPLLPEEGKALFADFVADNSFDAVAVLMSAGESRFYGTTIENGDETGAAPASRGQPNRKLNSGGSGNGMWKISAHSHKCLAEHQVAGRPTLPGALAVDMAVRSAMAHTAEFQSLVVKDVRFERFIALRGKQPAELKVKTELIHETGRESEYRIELTSDFMHSSGLLLSSNVLHYACHVHLARDVAHFSASPQFGPAGEFATIPDPYTDRRSPVYLSGPFRCLHDIRIGSALQSASFLAAKSELLPELAHSVIPCLLLDALCRLSMLCVEAGGNLPVCVPLRCGRIVVAAGANDRNTLDSPIHLRAHPPRIDGEMMLSSYAEASTPDAGIVLALYDLTAKRMGALNMGLRSQTNGDQSSGSARMTERLQWN